MNKAYLFTSFICLTLIACGSSSGDASDSTNDSITSENIDSNNDSKIAVFEEQEEEECKRCNGTGKETCLICGGHGFYIDDPMGLMGAWGTACEYCGGDKNAEYGYEDDIPDSQKGTGKIECACKKTGMNKNAKTVKELVPKNWTFESKEGDINNDGVGDVIIIAKPDYADHIIEDDEGNKNNYNTPVLAVYLGDKEKGFRLWKQYRDILSRNEAGTTYTYTLNITSKGSFTVSESIDSDEGASYSSGSETRCFRYQDNNIYCIGYEQSELSRNTGECVEKSYNFLTHKVITTTYNEFDESVKKKTTTKDIPEKALVKLGTTRMFGE